MKLVKLDEANVAVNAIEDPITKELVRYSLGLLVGKFVRWDADVDPVDLPEAPFDAAFYVRCMTQFLARHERIAGMLAGEIVDEFGGNNV